MKLRTRALVLAPLTALLLAGCSYESGTGVAGRDPSPSSSSTTEGPDGALAFSVEGLSSSTWRVFNTDDGLNLRVAPGTDSRSLALLAPGTLVTATGNVITVGGDSWFRVQAEGHDGWVHSGYLMAVDADVAAAAAQDESPLDTVAAAWPAGTELLVIGEPGANLRDEPAGKVVVELITGTSVTVTGSAVEEWTEIRTSNLRGWVLSALLGDALEATTTPFAAGTPVRPKADRDGASIHDAPGGSVISGLPGTEVALATGQSRSGWTELTHRGITGWARTAQLKAARLPTGTGEPTEVTIDGEGGPVTVHLGPSGLDPIVAELADGATATTTGVTTPAGWSEIELDDVRTGWVPTVFLIFPG